MEEMEPNIEIVVPNEIARVLKECKIHRDDGSKKWYRICDLMETVESFYGAEAASLIRDEFTTELIEKDEFSDRIKNWVIDSYPRNYNHSRESDRSNAEELNLTLEETYEENASEENEKDKKCTYEMLQQSLSDFIRKIKMSFLDISEMQEASVNEKSFNFKVDIMREMEQVKSIIRMLREELREHLHECPTSSEDNNLEQKIQCVVSKKTDNFIIWCKEQIEDLKEVQKSPLFEIDKLNQKRVFIDLGFMNYFNDQLNSLKESQEKYEANFSTLSRKISKLSDDVDELNCAIENLTKQSQNHSEPKRVDHQKSLLEELNEECQNHSEPEAATFIKGGDYQKSFLEEFNEADLPPCIDKRNSTFSNKLEIIHYHPQVFASTPVQRKVVCSTDKTVKHLKNTTQRRLKYRENQPTKNVFTSRNDELADSAQSFEINSLSSDSSSESTHFERIVKKKSQNLYNVIFDDDRSKYFDNQPTQNVSSSKNESSDKVSSSTKNEFFPSNSSPRFEPLKAMTFKNLCKKSFSFKRIIKTIFITLSIIIIVMSIYWTAYSSDHNVRRFQRFLLSFLYEMGFADRVERRGPLPY